MKREYSRTLGVVLSLLFVLLGSATASAQEGTSPIKDVTAINRIFSDGLKTEAVVVEYNAPIKQSELKKSDFEVRDKTITKIYANDTPEEASVGKNGRYVILQLSTDYELPVQIGEPAHTGSSAQHPSSPQNNMPQQTMAEMLKVRGNPPAHPAISLSSKAGGNGLLVYVRQAGTLTTIEGNQIEPQSDWSYNQKDVNLVLDGFSKPDFHDPKTGKMMKFSLFVPYHYDPAKSYPLVLFIQDEYSCRPRHDEPLLQGLGGVVWAEPSEQAKHECFVLVPAYFNAIADSSFKTTQDLDITMDLLDTLQTLYNIDAKRLYLTGQSMGAMAALAMNEKYPNRFAASLLIAGSWNPQSAFVMKQKNLWFVASEGDTVTTQRLRTFVSALEKSGAKVTRSLCDGRAPQKEFQKAAAASGNIKFTLFKSGTVVPSGKPDTSFNNRLYSWRIAYEIEPLRDWLFRQSKQ